MIYFPETGLREVSQMIRLRVEKLSRVFLVLCTVYLSIFQIGMPVAYGEGTTISFSSVTVGGIQTSTQSLNTGQISAGTQDVNIENYTLLMSIFNKYLQIDYDGLQNPQAATQIPSIITLYQSVNNNNSSSVTNRKPDPIDELIKFMHFSPLPANESLLPLAEQYVIKICLAYNNLTASGCPEAKTSAQASEILGSMIANKDLNDIEPRPIQIVLPSAMPQDHQMKVLVKIEMDAISMIESGITEVQKGKPDISYDGRSARLEAESGINWTHDLKEDRSIHLFHAGKAYSKSSHVTNSDHR